MTNEITKYMCGKEEIILSNDIIRKYLVNGNGQVTEQELLMFRKLCQYQRLNPFLREVYLIKYSSDSPATMVTGKETFLKRANRNQTYAGHQTGISTDGKTAWACVYRQGFDNPIKCEVDYNEYVGLKNGQPNRMWKSKPKTMLKKVALVQALREAFPADLVGLYAQEEINTLNQDLPTEEIKQAKVHPEKEEMQRDPAEERVKVTKQQIKIIYVLLGKLNITDDFEKHQQVSSLLNHREVIKSLNDLTKDEAGIVITALQDLEKEKAHA